ncbi:MAG: CHAD domain-containing protein [Clostridiaceae bacterium]
MDEKSKSPLKADTSLILNKKRDASESLRDLLLELLNSVTFYLNQFTRNPDDPENIHQLRVYLRKLRSVLYLSKSYITREVYKSRQKTLRNLANQLGEIRELDVLSQELGRISIIPTDNPLVLDSLNSIILSHRNAANTTILEKINHGYFTEAISDFKTWLCDKPFTTDINKKVSISGYVNSTLSKLSKKFLRSLKNVNLSDNEELHRLRIQEKKLRYIEESYHPIINHRKIKLKNDLKSLQDILGRLHDISTNLILIENFIKDSSDPQLALQAGIFIGFQTAESALLRKKISKLSKKYQCNYKTY